MANSGGADKSEQPTGKRLSESRDKGQVAKSKEGTAVFLLILGVSVIMIFENTIGGKIKDFTTHVLSSSHTFELNREILQQYCLKGLLFIMSILFPIFIVLVIGSLIAGFAQAGFKWTWKPLKPKIAFLNVFKGIKNILFSTRSLFELAKSIVIFTIIGSVSYGTVKSLIEKSTALIDYSIEDMTAFMFKNAYALTWKIIGAMLVIGIIDFYYQKKKHIKDLKMAKQEVKDENKQSEGDPLIKGKIKSKQFEMARSRMMSAVPKADVVIANPTHYAVALKYEAGSNVAPKILAKGTDRMALKIKEVAKEHNIPIYEDIAVARALYAACEVGDEIPTSLFKAVAQILAYIYQQKNAKKKKSIV